MKFTNYILTYIVILNAIFTITSISLRTNYAKHDTLFQDEKLESKSGKYFAVMQSDGNFVLYSAKGLNGRDRDYPIWASQTFRKGTAPYRVVLQEDGNLVLYDNTNRPLWNSNTYNKGHKPYNAIVQDDGNFVLYDKNRPKWASNTNGRR